MATLYARIPDALHDRVSQLARDRGLTVTAATIMLLTSALDSAERARQTAANRGGRYRDDA